MSQVSAAMARFWLVTALATGCGNAASPSDPNAGAGTRSQGSTIPGEMGSMTARGGTTNLTSGGNAQNLGGYGATPIGGAVATASDPMQTGGANSSAAGGNNAAGSAAGIAGGSTAVSAPDHPNVLVFSRTLGYRHPSIEPGIRALKALAAERGFALSATEDPTVFSASGLADYHVVLFLSTTGGVLDEAQQAALEQFIRNGRGFVGVHAASDTEYDWPWFGDLVGAYFRDHPPVQSATLLVEDRSHPSTAQLPTAWTRTDEWYAFRENPRAKVNVLMRLDESTYEPGVASMGADHPIAWYHVYDGGRAFYTGLGHTDESFQEPSFLDHLAGAIVWAAGL